MASMSLDRPGAGGDELDDEFTEMLDLCLREPRHAAPVPAAGYDWHGRVRRWEGPQRRTDPARFLQRASVVRRRTASAHGRAYLPPEDQIGTRVASQARHRLVSASARPATARLASRGAGSRNAVRVAAMPHGVS